MMKKIATKHRTDSYYYGIKEIHFRYRNENGTHIGEFSVVVNHKDIICSCSHIGHKPCDCTFEISRETWESFVDLLVNKYKVLKINKKMLQDACSEIDDDLSVHLCIKRTFFRKLDLDADKSRVFNKKSQLPLYQQRQLTLV